MVIKHAQNRMVGLPANSHSRASIDSKSLRFEVISLLKEAWNTGALLEVRKKKKNGERGESKSVKKGQTLKRVHSEEDVGLRRSRRKRAVKTSQF
jgi:hypothetical protein